MNLYVMRHGTTIWNEKNIIQGRSHNRLSKSGAEHTERVAQEIKDIKLDAIICSPLMRTVQTAKIINNYHNVKIIKDDRLIELDQGVFTGRNKAGLTLQEMELKRVCEKSTRAETYADCFTRVKEFVDNLKADYDYENLLVITHNCCASFIENIICDINVNFEDVDFLSKFKNAEIKKFII